jgi:hypothetical protein
VAAAVAVTVKVAAAQVDADVKVAETMAATARVVGLTRVPETSARVLASLTKRI